MRLITNSYAFLFLRATKQTVGGGMKMLQQTGFSLTYPHLHTYIHIHTYTPPFELTLLTTQPLCLSRQSVASSVCRRPSIDCSICSNRNAESLAHEASSSPWFAVSTCKCYRNAIKLQSWQIGLSWTHFIAPLRPWYLSAASTLQRHRSHTHTYLSLYVCVYIYACLYLSLTVGF